MSAARSVLGALAALSVLLATSAGTEGEVTRLLGLASPSPPARGDEQRTNGTGPTATRPPVAANSPGTQTSSPRAYTTRQPATTSQHSSGSPRIPGADAASIGPIDHSPSEAGDEAIIEPSVTTPPATSPVTWTSTRVKVTEESASPPRQERLVATDRPPEDLAATTAHPGDGTSAELTSRPTESSPNRDKAHPVANAAGKAGGGKSRNDLVGGSLQIKQAQKVNSVHQNLGGIKVKPHMASAMGKYAPYFEDEQDELNVTARIGSNVVLDCEIGMLGNKTVTWSYRSADVFRLLTVGRHGYSFDQRVSLYFRYPTNWRLRIQYATPRDSGLYECQVATYPPLVKKIHLLVTAPILVIMDDSGRIKSGERHLKAGSALRLRCEARDVPERYNETVIWNRGDETLSEDVSENRTTDYLDGREIQVVVSTITVEKATPRHAGNYSCVVPEKAKATVAVHVLNGELPAAVHDGNGVSRSVLNLWLIHLTVSYVFSR